MSRPQLILSPHARPRLVLGFNQLADLLTTTLGPSGRTVVMQDEHPRRPPVLLNDGATIARRFTGFPQRFESMGALLARQIAWTMEETVGDGSTTAVVIARALINAAERHIAAGYNAMRLRIGLEKTLPPLLAALEEMARPLNDPTMITTLATTVTGSQQLGDHIEEIFDVVGAHGAVDVRRNYGVTHEREYIRGVFWNQGWVSSTFTTEAGKAVLKDPYVLLTNRHLTAADELVPLLEKIHNAGKQNKQQRGLVVIANGIQGEALNLLVSNKVRDILPTLAIKTPGLGPEKNEILHDLAAVCGGQTFLSEAPTRLQDATLDDLGAADEIQAIRSGFTLIGGKGRPAAIRQRAAELRTQLPQAAYGRDRNRLLERSGKLLGGVALLKVGGSTDTERDYLRDRAKEAVGVLRLALDAGIVPGGGVAYLRALPILDQVELAGEEAIARTVMQAALQAPARAILRNAGVEAAPIISRLCDASSPVHGDPTAQVGYDVTTQVGYDVTTQVGYDVTTHRFTELLAAGIVDPLPVVIKALEVGTSGALMAMTTDALVSKPRHNRDEAVDFRV